jgi:hypothetical protein
MKKIVFVIVILVAVFSVLIFNSLKQNEIEIKISVGDFRKDKYKRKWEFQKRYGIWNNKIKHYYYAMPSAIYEKVKNEIPEIAGVYIINDFNDVHKVKDAQLIKGTRKLSLYEMVALYRLCMFRYWGIRKKIA